MTGFEAPRGLVRAALSSVLPHAGSESKETPLLGRLRLVGTGDGVLVWATDHRTAAVARIEGPEYSDGELPEVDLPADAVRKVLQVFRPPSNPGARSMWNDAPMLVDVGDSLVSFTEVGSIVDGQSLSVPRIVPAGEDRYPDVPRELLALADEVRVEPAELHRFDVAAIARFVPAAQAYCRDVSILTVHAGMHTHQILVRIGHAVLGSAPAYPAAAPDAGMADVRVDIAFQVDWWSELLGPLRRLEPIRVSQAAADDLTRQAAEVLRDVGEGVTLRVVPTFSDAGQ